MVHLNAWNEGTQGTGLNGMAQKNYEVARHCDWINHSTAGLCFGHYVAFDPHGEVRDLNIEKVFDLATAEGGSRMAEVVRQWDDALEIGFQTILAIAATLGFEENGWPIDDELQEDTSRTFYESQQYSWF